MSEALAIDKSLYHDSCHHRIYRLSCDEFDALHELARGCCQICGLPEAEAARGRLCIDHLGQYGFQAVRGLLCDKCNALMSRVDCGEIRNPIPEVYRYRHQSWFARQMYGGPMRLTEGRWVR